MNCESCLDANTCLTCKQGFVLNGTICISLDSACIDNEHCDLDNTNGTDYGHIEIIKPTYNGTTSESNSGALNIINNGVTLINATFTSSQSSEGGGGAIYIYNNIDDVTKTNNITIRNLDFESCSAKYGGGVFIYSATSKSPVLVESCTFVGNTAMASKSNQFYGESALYIVSTSTQIRLLL